MSLLKIILADDQTIFRVGTARLLAAEPDFRIVAQCETPDRLWGALESFRSSIVLLATSLCPDMAHMASEAQRTQARVILVADHGELADQHARHKFPGFTHRTVSGPALVECIRKVARGGNCIHTGKTEVAQREQAHARARERLTERELRIVALLVQGMKNKEIAAQLGTSEQMVKNALRTVYDKTGVSDRLELALFTMQSRILTEAAATAAATDGHPSARAGAATAGS
jgi:DNA-binding NarL/FixJ family response regulator